MSGFGFVELKWQISDGGFIRFKQSTIGAIYGFDNEHGDFEEWTVSEYTVYPALYESLHMYLWNDGKYSYSIECSEELPFEAINQIILSVAEKE